MDKFFLIDGSSFIFRAFYGIPPMFRSDGTPVNAVFGFCSMFLRLIAKRKHGRYAVIADSPGKTFRNNLYDLYKANRVELPEELKPQFDLIKEAVDAFCLPSIAMPGFEADDIIAAYAKEAHEKGHEVEIISSDKDLMQLVNSTVYMYDAMKDKEIRKPQVIEKFGIRPDQVVDLQAMMGDSSDNIPGVKGVGPKTAAKLLLEFETLEGVYENIDKIPQAGLKKKLIENKEMAFLSRQLVQLEDTIPGLPSLEDIQEANVNIEKLRKFFEKMEFRQLAPRLDNLNGGTKKKNDYVAAKVFKTSIEADIFIEKLSDQKQITLALFDEGMCVHHPNTGGGVFKFQEEASSLFTTTPSFFEKLNPLLMDEKIEKIGFNMKEILHHLEGQIKNYTDVQIMAYDVLGESGFKKLCRHFHLTVAPLFQESFDGAGYEANGLWQLHEELKSLLDRDEKRTKLYETIDAPLLPVLYEMEKNGIAIDTLKLKNIDVKIMKEIASLDEKIRRDIPEDVNLDSPKQLGAFLFETLGLEYKGRKTSSGQYSTDNKHLQKVMEQHAVIDLILQRRAVVKLKSTYIDGLGKTIQKDGRIHTTYLQNFVNTGRLSSRNPNLQNIPIRTGIGRELRQIFVPQKDWVLIAADYSQIELRIMAHLAQVKNLIQAFKDDRDIHSETAVKMFNTKEVTHEHRRKAKIINFSMIYGATPYGLGENLGVDVKTAKAFMDTYFEVFPEIKDYMVHKEEEGKTKGFVETLLGRKCYMPIEHGRDARFVARVAVNAPVQGTAADVMRLAMIEVNKFLKKEKLKTRMLLQIHDEIIFESPQDEVKKIQGLIPEIMEKVIELDVPIKVDMGTGQNWDEAH